MEQEKKQNKIVSILVNIVFGLVVTLTILISVVALSARANNGIPNISGTSVLNVLTDSMSGTIEKGDLIFVELLKEDELEKKAQIKDRFIVNETIATFKYDINADGNADYVTHRLVGKTENDNGLILLFQGDKGSDDPNLDVAYQQVAYYDVVGVYTGNRIAKLGSIMGFLQTSTGFLVVFVLPLFLYFCFQGYKLFATAMEVKRENAVELGKLTDEAREEEKRRIREEILREMNQKDDNKE